MAGLWRAIPLLLLFGCASEPVIPESLEPQIDNQLTFAQILESPDAYKGKLVVVGGEVLKAKGLREGTQLEVLQLPLGAHQRPADERTRSQGRFLALHAESVDPAKFTDGTPITIVGEVTGSATKRLDETEYRYPTLDVKHLHVWTKRIDNQAASRPTWGVFGGVGMGGGGMGGGGGVGVGF
jgi:outer membrane lipoprotein